MKEHGKKSDLIYSRTPVTQGNKGISLAPPVQKRSDAVTSNTAVVQRIINGPADVEAVRVYMLEQMGEISELMLNTVLRISSTVPHAKRRIDAMRQNRGGGAGVPVVAPPAQVIAPAAAATAASADARRSSRSRSRERDRERERDDAHEREPGNRRRSRSRSEERKHRERDDRGRDDREPRRRRDSVSPERRRVAGPGRAVRGQDIGGRGGLGRAGRGRGIFGAAMGGVVRERGIRDLDAHRAGVAVELEAARNAQALQDAERANIVRDAIALVGGLGAAAIEGRIIASARRHYTDPAPLAHNDTELAAVLRANINHAAFNGAGRDGGSDIRIPLAGGLSIVFNYRADTRSITIFHAGPGG
jgi:hypothetical protein